MHVSAAVTPATYPACFPLQLTPREGFIIQVRSGESENGTGAVSQPIHFSKLIPMEVCWGKIGVIVVIWATLVGSRFCGVGRHIGVGAGCKFTASRLRQPKQHLGIMG